MVTKKLYRLLRAGNIQIYHLRAKESDSERRGAHTACVILHKRSFHQWVIQRKSHRCTVILLHPWFASARARCRPMPDPAPVINAALPSTFIALDRMKAASTALAQYRSSLIPICPDRAKFLLRKILLSHEQGNAYRVSYATLADRSCCIFGQNPANLVSRSP